MSFAVLRVQFKIIKEKTKKMKLMSSFKGDHCYGNYQISKEKICLILYKKE